MSEIKVNSIKGVGASAAAITVNNTDGTCTANITNNLSNRNLIINGAMQCWQRGVSTTTSSSYQADRFWVVNQGTYARDNSAPDGFQYSAKLTHSSSNMAIGTPIELPATGNASPLVSGNTFTVSFYGKADSGTEDVNLLCRYRNSKFSGTNQVDFTGTGQTFTLTTSWQRFTKTFTIPTINANNTIISIEVDGIGATAYFTGFQAELGSVATDFEHRSFGQEMQLCKRYYQLCQGNTGYAYGSTAFRAIISGTVEMRAAPSIAIVNGTNTVEDFGTANRNISSLGGLSSGSVLGGLVDATITSTTSGKAHALIAGAISMSAEL